MFAAGVVSAACAVSVNAGVPVSLDSCRNMALTNNKTIAVASQAVKGAEMLRKAAFTGYLPSVNFTGGYMYNQHKMSLLSEDAKLPTMSFDPATKQYHYNLLTAPDGSLIRDPATGSPIPTEVAVIPKEAMTFDTQNIFAGAFTITQPIFLGGEIKALNDIAEAGQSMAQAGRDATTREVRFAVDEAYWLVVSLSEKEKLAQSFVNLVDSLNRTVHILHDNGMATKSDILTAEVRLNEARIAQTKVQNGTSLARMALAQLCGLPVDSDLRLVDEVGITPAAPYASTTSDNMTEVYARRADLEVLRQGIRLAEGKEKVALGGMLPKIAAVGGWGFSNPNLNNGFSKKFGGNWSVGATVTVPIWNWGRDYYTLRAAKAATNAQRMLLEDAEEKVSLQVNQARFKVAEANKTLNMTETNLKSADENLRQAQIAFREGVITVNEVMMAQTAWMAAHSENIDSQIALRLCHTYLAKVLGL